MAIGGAALIIGWLGIVASPITIHGSGLAGADQLRATQALVRSLGLDPDRLVAASAVAAADSAAFLPIALPSTADRRVVSPRRIGPGLAALTAALAAVPAYMPVTGFSYSSPFGVRFDPFTGNSAMHAGVDMAGRRGEPVHAAAAGTVALAARAGGYGNCVELDHGSGLATRYGHLSAILVHPGDRVAQGDVIARMGSTGRSTGTHLHFEVRVDGRAVDPRPYLDASAAVLAAQRAVVEVPSAQHAAVAALTAAPAIAAF